jgi:hypothetical protein
MNVVLCRSRVTDEPRWKAAGLRLRDQWRDRDDPDHVFCVLEVVNLDSARAVFDDPANAEYRFLSTIPEY